MASLRKLGFWKRGAFRIPRWFHCAIMASRAKPLAERLASEATNDPARIERACQLLYSRPPAAAETRLGLAYLADTSSGEDGSRWVSYVQALLSAHEFRQIQ